MAKGTEGCLRGAQCGRGAVVAVALQKELAHATCGDLKTYKQICSEGARVQGASLKVSCWMVDSLVSNSGELLMQPSPAGLVMNRVSSLLPFLECVGTLYL